MDIADILLSEVCQRYNVDFNKLIEQIEKDGNKKVIVNLIFDLTSDPKKNMYLAGAIDMWELYKHSLLSVADYANFYQKRLRSDVYQFLIDHADKLDKILDFRQDFDNIYFSTATMIAMYLSRPRYDMRPNEVPQMAFLRIAAGKFCTDSYESVVEMYQAYSQKKLTPSSPTIFNEGFNDGAPSSCMIYSMDDSMDDILSVIQEAGMACKNSAGLGIDVSGLRHSAIGFRGISQGIIPLITVLDHLIKYINQAGTRKGACTVSLRSWHYDLPEFVEMLDPTREESMKVSRLNLSIMVEDVFMEHVRDGKPWYLFCPKQANELLLIYGNEFRTKYYEMVAIADKWNRYKKYLAFKETSPTNPNHQSIFDDLQAEFDNQPEPRQVDCRIIDPVSLMRTVCSSQIKTGGPYIVYGCSVNRKNPMMNVGVVRGPNLCQETMIPSIPREQTGCCNLAAISLPAFVKDKQFDFLQMGQTVQLTVKGLNRIIDTSINVSDKVKLSNTLSRPIGIGVSGLADMLALMDLSITKPETDFSPKALLFRQLNPEVSSLNRKIWSCMYYNALKSSIEEAKQFGPCPKFEGSPASKGKLQYHLWQDEAAETNRVYPFSLEPVDPSEWGQDGSWDSLISDIKQYGLRNLMLLSGQPTASTAQLIGNCESFELHASGIYTRKVMAGEFPVINLQMVEDLKAIGAWNKRVYNNIVNSDGSVTEIPEDWVLPEHRDRLRFIKEKYLTMWQVPQRLMVRLAMERQIVMCHSQSMNLYIPHPSVDQLMKIHQHIWSLGAKTGMYYLRSKANAEPLKIKVLTNPVSEQVDDCLSELTKEKISRDNKEMDDLIDNSIKARRPEVCQMISDCLVCG